MKTTDTPRTNACPHCGAESYISEDAFHDSDGNPQWRNITRYECGSTAGNKAQICFEREYRKKAEAEAERLSKLTEDCLNVIRVYCPTYYNDAMERFNKTNK